VEKLKNLDKLLIRQHLKWAEVFTSIEMKNKYDICDTDGNILFRCGETGGSLLGRIFLRSLRPFTMTVFNDDGSVALSCKRPFKFLFHEISVFDGYNQPIGIAKWQFSILRHRYKIFDRYGNEIFNIEGTILKPWTFYIKKDGVEVGIITKRWMGVFKELFTTSDNFGIQFPVEWSTELKQLFIGIVFLIDFVHFEHHK